MSETVSVCFTCNKSYKGNLVPINELDSDRVSYLEKLLAFVPNLIQTNDMQICKHCIKLLKTSYNFHKLVEKSQKSLRCEEIFNSSIEVSQIDNDKFNNDLDDFLIPKKELEEIEENFIEEQFTIIKTESDDKDQVLLNKKKVKNTENEDVRCLVCNIKLKNSEDVIKHKCEKEKKSSDRVLHCNTCNKRFFRIHSYYNHLIKIHGMEISTEERKHQCKFCEKSFKKMFQLKEHETTHTGEKNFTCPICEKKFQRASSKSRHVKNHHIEGGKTKKTPYLCTICGKSFPFSNGAQRHMRTHTGERKFHCKICNKKFMQSTHLHVHMRVHTGEKPYICHHCGESFSIRASLLKHIKNHDKKGCKSEKKIDNMEENSKEEEFKPRSCNVKVVSIPSF